LAARFLAGVRSVSAVAGAFGRRFVGLFVVIKEIGSDG
jgi:hypothetical protein